MLKKKLVLFILLAVGMVPVQAHHVLGRPAYAVGEDGTTPPSLELETQLGDYFVTMMSFPAFLDPKDQGRMNLYASRIDNGSSFHGEVTFKLYENGWFASDQMETLGIQKIDDGVYRQPFMVSEEGDYVIRAEFHSDGQPYIVEFPITVGDPAPIGPIGLALVALAALLVGVNVVQRRRLGRLKATRHHDEVRTEP